MLCLDLPPIGANEKASVNYDILVVEDEQLIRNMIALNLADEGYNVIQAENGREALNVLERIGEENSKEKNRSDYS